MNELINKSLKYPLRSDAFLRMLAVGGLVTFVELVALRAILAILYHRIVLNDSFLDSMSIAIQGGLIALAFMSFVILTGFYVRIAEHVISGEKTPPPFADSKQLMFNGALFCATLLAIIALVLTVELVVGMLLFVFLVVVEAYLGVPSLTTVTFVLWFLFGIIPVAIMIVYPQPSIWILIARFRLRSDTVRSYFRFVASRKFISELGSMLLSRKYISSWAALIVVSILNGAATIEGDSILAANQPIDLIIGLNTRYVSAVVSFYASVAVVYLFATRFGDRDQYRQTSLFESDSYHDSR